MGRHNFRRMTRLGWSAKAGLITTLIAALFGGILAITVAQSAAAPETPAQRCARETAAYNQTWKEGWSRLTGRPVEQAPDPYPPYICGQTPTITPTPSSPSTTTPTTTVPPTSGAPSSTAGPNLNPPTTTSSPVNGVTPGQPTIAPPGETSPQQKDDFTGSRCDISRQAIIRATRALFKGNIGFSCTGLDIDLYGTRPSGGEIHLAGNNKTNKFVDVTDMNDLQIDAAKEELGNNVPLTPLDEACQRAISPITSQRVMSSYQGELIVRFCYGDDKDGKALQWWNRIDITYRTNLGQKNSQEFRYTFSNVNRMPADVTVEGRFRKDVKDDDDENIESTYYNSPGGLTGTSTDRDWLDTSSGYGIYFYEHTKVYVKDLVHQRRFSSSYKKQMDRFRCPKQGVCKYPYGKPAPTHYDE